MYIERPKLSWRDVILRDMNVTGEQREALKNVESDNSNGKRLHKNMWRNGDRVQRLYDEGRPTQPRDNRAGSWRRSYSSRHY